MSTRREQQGSGGGLSASTLAIASVSSIAAAYVIHTFWKGGAILGAGITPVVVAIVSESLKRPTQRITAIREERRMRTMSPGPPAPEPGREDPFGIWEADRRSRFHWVRGRALKIAVATGLLAFAIAAFVVTGADLVFGSGDNGGDRLKIVPGTQERKAEKDEPETEPRTVTVPGTEAPAPTTPQTTPVVPPTETAPAPAPPAETAPAPAAPAPTTPTEPVP